MDKCLGWTVEQLAWAKSRYDEIECGDIPGGIKGILTLKNWWAMNWCHDPLTIKFIGIDYDIDRSWAANAFYEAVSDIYPPVKKTKMGRLF